MNTFDMLDRVGTFYYPIVQSIEFKYSSLLVNEGKIYWVYVTVQVKEAILSI